jgi:hypothetical protein
MRLRFQSTNGPVEIVSLVGRFGWVSVNGIVIETVMLPWDRPYIEPPKKTRFWDRFHGWRSPLVLSGIIGLCVLSFTLGIVLMTGTCP